jgi:hypothetical protein
LPIPAISAITAITVINGHHREYRCRCREYRSRGYRIQEQDRFKT